MPSTGSRLRRVSTESWALLALTLLFCGVSIACFVALPYVAPASLVWVLTCAIGAGWCLGQDLAR